MWQGNMDIQPCGYVDQCLAEDIKNIRKKTNIVVMKHNLDNFDLAKKSFI